MRTITFVDLAEHGACTEQAALFVSTFGTFDAWRGVPLTEENIRIAYDEGLAVNWLLHVLGLCEAVYDDNYPYAQRTCDDINLIMAALVAYGLSDEVVAVKEETPIDE